MHEEPGTEPGFYYLWDRKDEKSMTAEARP
jgi:hypothetical protein